MMNFFADSVFDGNLVGLRKNTRKFCAKKQAGWIILP